MSTHHVSPFRSETAQSFDGLALRVFEAGPPRAPALLLVNALGMPMELMAPLARALSAEFRVISWESRAFPGPLVDTATKCGIDAHQRDALTTLRHFGVENALAAFGWCEGARVALHTALSNPARVGAVVCVNGSFRFPGAPRSAVQLELEPVLRKVAEDPALARVFCTVMRSAAAAERAQGLAARPADSPLLRLVHAPYETAEHLARYALLFRRDDGIDDREALARLRAPVLLISSQRDQVANPEGSSTMAELLPRASHSRLADADHYVIYDRPELVQQAFQTFMASRTSL